MEAKKDTRPVIKIGCVAQINASTLKQLIPDVIQKSIKSIKKVLELFSKSLTDSYEFRVISFDENPEENVDMLFYYFQQSTRGEFEAYLQKVQKYRKKGRPFFMFYEFYEKDKYTPTGISPEVEAAMKGFPVYLYFLVTSYDDAKLYYKINTDIDRTRTELERASEQLEKCIKEKEERDKITLETRIKSLVELFLKTTK